MKHSKEIKPKLAKKLKKKLLRQFNPAIVHICEYGLDNLNRWGNYYDFFF